MSYAARSRTRGSRSTTSTAWSPYPTTSATAGPYRAWPCGDASGGQDKNISTVEGDGTFGAFYGLMRVLSGHRAAVVVAHSKGSEGDVKYITNAMFDPVFQRHLGIESVSAAALQARSYMDLHGVSEEQCAQVSVKNHSNAKNNPCAQLAMDLTVEDVMKSRRLADPIKLLDCSPVSDGAAAIIIAGEEIAEKSRKKPVWIQGVAHCAEEYFLGDRDLADPKALRDAASRAYAMAGIRHPSQELDVAEVLRRLFLHGAPLAGGPGPL